MSEESSNPFTNAKVVGENVSGADYRKNTERGDPAYVMSRSDLMEFAWCPARWIAGYDDDGSKATELLNNVKSEIWDLTEHVHRGNKVALQQWMHVNRGTRSVDWLRAGQN